ncbi:hypothetical protein AHAS_Ahas14G0153700 [Arachis hypogaea]
MDKKTAHGPLYFDLNTGGKIPSVGLGTWKAPPGEIGNAVIAAVKAGYRHIDCARVYDNEKEVGDALKKLFSSGVVQRSDLFITSKIWTSDCAPEDVSKALTRTLEDLQLDYIDLYLDKARFTRLGSRDHGSIVSSRDMECNGRFIWLHCVFRRVSMNLGSRRTLAYLIGPSLPSSSQNSQRFISNGYFAGTLRCTKPVVPTKVLKSCGMEKYEVQFLFCVIEV